MKRYLSLFFALISLILISALLIYFLPQSQQVGPWFAKALSKNNEFSINFSHIEHSLNRSDTMTIHNLSIKTATHENILTAKKITLKFNTLSDFLTLSSQKNLSFKDIYIEDGQVNLVNLGAHRTIFSEQLRLKNVNYDNTMNNFRTQFVGVTAEINSWHSNSNEWLSSDSIINFFASKAKFSYQKEGNTLTLNNSMPNISEDMKFIFGDRFELTNISFNGKRLENVWFVDTLGFDWLSGVITLSGRFSHDYWRIDKFFMDNILHDFNLDLTKQEIIKHKNIQIKELSVINSTLSGIDWALEDIYLKAHYIDVVKGRIQRAKENKPSKIEFIVNKLLFNDVTLNQLSFSTTLNNNEWQIHKIAASFLNGFIAFDGIFDLAKNHLAIDKLTANDFSFTVQALPSALIRAFNALENVNDLTVQSLQIKNFSLQSTSQFLPWQIRDLTLNGQSLKIKENNAYSLFRGIFNGSMNTISLNKVDIDEGFSFNLLVDNTRLYFSDIHGANSEGYISIPKLSISKNTPKKVDITLSAQSLSPKLFSYLYIPSIALTENVGSSVNINANLNGILPKSFKLSSLLMQSSKIEHNFDLTKYLSLTGNIQVFNTAKFGETNERFDLFYDFKDGFLVSQKEERLPSLQSLRNQLKRMPSDTKRSAEDILAISNKAHEEIDGLFNLYQSILLNHIDLKMNKLKTAPFFDNVPQDVNEIELISE